MTPSAHFELSQAVAVKGRALFARGRTVRREIRRWWVETPTRWVAWLMLNPSIAGERRDDPTTLRVTRFTQSWGFDGWIGVNLYPFVSSDPAAMWQRANRERNGPDWYARHDMQANCADLERVARLSCLRVVAFGAAPIERDQGWLEQCLEAFGQPADLPERDSRLYCLGVSKSGHPLHPMARGRMRVPDNAQPILWRPRE
jgi:hypothetical protein